MSLYVKVFTNFYTHRKTMRLRAVLGDDAFWVPPRLWAYAADNQPDGDFGGYSDVELALLIGYVKDASSMLQALVSSGFLDSNRKIHDWKYHNAYHETYSERAKTAATARWEQVKERTKEKEDLKGTDKRGEERRQASDKHATSIDSSQHLANQPHPTPVPEIPSEPEFIALFTADGIPDDFLKKQWAWFEGNNGWLDQRGKLKKFPVIVRSRWAQDRAQWGKNANGHAGTNGAKPKSVWELQKIAAAKQEQVDNLYAENANESMGRYEWEEGTEKEKAQCKQLLKEIDDINKQIAGMKT